MGSALFVANTVLMLIEDGWSFEQFIRPVRRFLDAYIEMTSDLTLLLATLAIMTGALVITGVPTKLGAILIDLAGVNLVAMVVLAFVFGALLGTGLPPAPTYILVAIVIAPLRNFQAADDGGNNGPLTMLLLQLWLFGLYLSSMESFFLDRADPLWFTFLLAVFGLHYLARFRVSD